MKTTEEIELIFISVRSVAEDIVQYIFVHVSHNRLLLIKVINKTWNGMEWKKLIKHRMELLNQHEMHPCTYGSWNYILANCSCRKDYRSA